MINEIKNLYTYKIYSLTYENVNINIKYTKINIYIFAFKN